MDDSPRPVPLPQLEACRLAEGPVWDDVTGHFHWVDITAGRLFTMDPSTAVTTTFDLGGACGFAVPTSRAGIWLAARGAEIVSLELATGQISVLANLAEGADLRCNDAKCDPQGRLWVGTMPYAWGEFTGSFYRFESGHSPAPQRRAIGCSNGLAWSPDGTRFYYIDSLTYQIDCYDWQAERGELSNPTVHIAFTQEQGMPDGMCIDREGHLWVAFWGGGCVRKIHGRTGAILAQIDLPVAHVTSCAFGGQDLDTLFITTASEGLDDAARAAQPLAGHIFTCQPGAAGLPVDRFNFAD